MLGTGKYKNFQEAKNAILLSSCEILLTEHVATVDPDLRFLNELATGDIKASLSSFLFKYAPKTNFSDPNVGMSLRE